MRKQSAVWLVTAFSLILIGCIVFGGVMTAMGWDFSKISTTKLETNSYEIHESFADISILSDTADITFVPAEDLKCSVVCYEDVKAKHSVSVEDGMLSIKLVDSRKWYDYISIFHFGTPKITVSIPQGQYGALFVKSDTGDVEIAQDFAFENINISLSTGDVINYAPASKSIKINTSTGKINVENVSADTLDLTASTGNITVSNVICEGDVKIGVSTGKCHLTSLKCNNIGSTGSTGDIYLKNVTAYGNFSIDRSTGDVTFEACDAAEIYVKTDTGNVTGSLLSEKVFITETDTGRIIVPETTTGGKCKIITDTGDIKIDISSQES